MRRFCLALVLLGAVACSETPTQPTPAPTGPPTPKATVTSIRIDGSEPEVGATSQLRATAVFSSGLSADASNDVTWVSSKPTIVSVSPTGLLTGRAVGTAEITASLQGISGKSRMLINGPGSYFMYISDPGDPIGQGNVGSVVSNFDVEAERPASNHVRAVFATSPGAAVDGLPSEMPRTNMINVQWELFLLAPDSQTLMPGTYENARQWLSGSPSIPRLQFWIGTRTCLESTGRFVVHDAVYGGGRTVLKFYATFEQRCDFSPAGLRGVIAYKR